MIKHILFDLDNTLYSVRYGLEKNVHDLILEYLLNYLALPREECIRQWKEGRKKYGTTVEWLTRDKGLTAVDEYHIFVHPENEADSLPPDPGLRNFLENLPCPCSILTNSPRFHADRIISKLGLEGIFRSVYDIHFIDFKSKPDAAAYRKVLDDIGHAPEEVLFVDDIASYVKGYIDIGGKGILLDEFDVHKEYLHPRIKNLYELSQYL